MKRTDLRFWHFVVLIVFIGWIDSFDHIAALLMGIVWTFVYMLD